MSARPTTGGSTAFSADEAFALEQDRRDPLAPFRERYHIPQNPNGDGSSIYLCGNSLGCQPRIVRERLTQHLTDWAELGVEGHFHAAEPWYPYHELLRESAARLVGALPHEVVVMNSLTVNLHLLMLSFYRPSGARNRILIDGPCFPSDVYAVRSHIRSRGLDPDECLRWVTPAPGRHTLVPGEIEAAIAREGDALALCLIAGVNYLTGEHYDMESITRAAHESGALIGWDLAHAAGNIPLRLHDIDADFAAWCSYKYLNSGPGAIAGAFIHERWTRHANPASFAAMARYEGWWGNDPASRFLMMPDFIPVPSADAWQLSNPPIFSMVPVKASLELFDEAGLDRLREKSLRLTGYLELLIHRAAGERVEIITPREPHRRGCQLSLLIHDRPRELHEALMRGGVICDFREPNVVRIAPTPLYNTFHDCWTFARILEHTLRR